MNDEFQTQVESSTLQHNALMEEQKQFALVGQQYPLLPSGVADAPPNPLQLEIAGNDVFERKYQWLSASSGSSAPPSPFKSYRPVRRDGSCFYRSALFQVFATIAMEVNGCLVSAAGVGEGGRRGSSAIVAGKPQMATGFRMTMALSQWKGTLVKYFGDFVEDFIHVTEDMTKKVMGIRIEPPAAATTTTTAAGGEEGSAQKAQEALRAWQCSILDAVAVLLNKEDDSVFEYIVCLARYGVSSFLRENAPIFAPFVSHIVDLGDDDLSMQTYCEKEVDVVGGECDEVHLLAFSAFFKVNLSIVMMDNNMPPSAADGPIPCEVKRINFFDTLTGFCGKDVQASDGLFALGPFAEAPLYLLYRPGHYEILLV